MIRLAPLVVAAAILGASPAHAAYVINVTQAGSDVIASGFGSLDVSALNAQGKGGFFQTQFYDPTQGIITLGAPSVVQIDSYTGINGPSSFGNFRGASGQDAGSGQIVSLRGLAKGVVVPAGYKSGADLGITTSTFQSSTIASLGLNVGTYVYSLGTSSDTLTLNIGAPAAVPESTIWALMITGFGFIGAMMRRKASHLGSAVLGD